MRPEARAGAGGGWRHALCVLLAAFSACFSGVARTDALDGMLEVRTAFVTLDNGVYQLTARIAYPMNDQIPAALKDGVTLSFEIETQVLRQRRFWTDATVAAFTLHRELSWHAVREQYLVRDTERGELGAYSSLDQALAGIGAVDNWPVLLEPQLQPDASYQIGVRASVRRGALPGALRALIWWSDSWQRTSDWFRWSLPR